MAILRTDIDEPEQTMIAKISAGSAEATTILQAMIDITEETDATGFEDRGFCLLHSDMIGLYGTDLSALHDHCGNDPLITLTVLRANKLHVLRTDEIRSAIGGEIILNISQIISRTKRAATERLRRYRGEID